MKEILKDLKEIYGHINEKIDKRMNRSSIIKEIMDSWEKKGTINNGPISSKEDALKRAEAIAYSIHPDKQGD